MGIRFRKYLTIGKLLRINISKSGISATIGVKGASVNIGKNGVYLNAGIPGSGIYIREKLFGGKKKKVSYSLSAIARAQSVLEEYDKKKIERNQNNQKSDIIPDVHIDELDEFFMDVAYFVVSEDCPSISQIKKKFDISYVQANEIMDKLERNGVVSPLSASSGRKVLISMNAYNGLKNKLTI